SADEERRERRAAEHVADVDGVGPRQLDVCTEVRREIAAAGERNDRRLDPPHGKGGDEDRQRRPRGDEPPRTADEPRQLLTCRHGPRLASIPVVLRAEAAWLARELEQLAAADLSPLLSIGSGKSELTADQPWLYRTVYEPLEWRGVHIVHHELEPAAGVAV